MKFKEKTILIFDSVDCDPMLNIYLIAQNNIIEDNMAPLSYWCDAYGHWIVIGFFSGKFQGFHL